MLEKYGLVPTSAKFVAVGSVFGRLTVVAVGQVPNTYRYMGVCRCECGTEKAIRLDHLPSGRVISCGCLQKEKSTKHGGHGSLHYQRWRGMLDRCYNRKIKSYKDYGGRGIRVCDAWHDFNTFKQQLPDGYFEGAEIDRIDNNGHYEPNNVRWVTKETNCNNRRTSTSIEYQGRTQTVTQWCRELGLNKGVVFERLRVWKWSAEKAFTTPSLSPEERMAIARAKRWGEHVKPIKLAPRILKTIEFEGDSVTLNQLADRTGINKNLLRKRIFERGWTVEKATQDRKDQ